MHKSGKAVVIAVGLSVLTVFCSVSFAEDQDQALIEAARKGDLRRVQELLDKGADVNANDWIGCTPLMDAVIADHLEIAKLLLDKGADVNAKARHGYSYTAMRLAASRNRPKIAELLKQRGAILTLETAAMLGDTERVREFLKKGIDGQDNGQALVWASRQGHLQVVKLLLDRGADVNAKGELGRTALMEASGRETELMEASESGHLEIVKFLLAKGADVNAQKDLGRWTALMSAAAGGNVEIVQALLDKGADINAKNYQGWTPLMWASEEGHLQAVKLLLDKGADVNAKDEWGNTALTSAAQRGNVEMVQALLDKGPDINPKDDEGWTPLMWAAAGGNVEIVQALLDKGADINAEDRKTGNTALDLALSEAQWNGSRGVEVEKLLRAHGAKEGQGNPDYP